LDGLKAFQFKDSIINFNKDLQWAILSTQVPDNRKVTPLNFSLDDDASNRIVNPQNILLTFETEGGMTRTNLGWGFPLDAATSAVTTIREVKAHERISSLSMGPPSTYKRQMELIGVKIKELESLPECDITSPWMDVSRQIDRSDETHSLITDRVVTKVPYIPSSEIRTPGFSEFQSDLDICLGDTLLIYERSELHTPSNDLK
jgi:hypothetical protein